MLTVPNFERLKVFHIVYLHRSIQRAADALGITRSAVSQSLKGLEAELGTTLFVRDSKKFQPTPPADELFKAIDPFVGELRAVLKQIESGKRVPVGHLRIGAPLDFGSDRLTRVIAKYREKYPEVTCELYLAVPVKQLEALCRGEIDLAFIDNGDVHAGRFPVTVQQAAEEEFVLVASREAYRRHGLREASFANLGKADFVDYLPGSPVARLWFKHHFKKVPPELRLVYSAESVRGVLTAIKCGIGVGVVPKHLLKGDFKDVVVVDGPGKAFVNQIVLVRQAGKKATAKEQEFIRVFRENPS